MTMLIKVVHLEIVLLSFISTWNITFGEDTCLRTNNEYGLPEFINHPAVRPSQRIPHRHQAIIPSYRLDCCGNITEWAVDFSPDLPNSDYLFILQVWRPNFPTSSGSSGCYSLVDDYSVSSLHYHIVQIWPPVKHQLQFQPEDVLGFYVESHGGMSDNDNGVVLVSNNQYTSELVWHARVTALTSSSGSCPYPVGSNGVLATSTHAAPLISISITTYPCSQSNSQVVTPSPTGSQKPPTSTIRLTSTSLPLETTGTNTGSLIAGVVVTVTFVCVVCVLVVIIAVVVVKRKQSSTMKDTTTNAFANLTYGQCQINPSPDDTYENPDAIPTFNLSISMNNEAVFYHSIGPGASKTQDGHIGSLDVHSDKPVSDIYHFVETAWEGKSGDPEHVYHENTNFEEPAAYEVPIEELFDKAGLHVPTAEERANCGHDCDKQDYYIDDYSKTEFFIEDQTYWTPASTTHDLYTQLSSKKYREIPRNQITTLTGDKLGSGEFGDVYKALWSISGTTKEMAVKTLKPGSSESEQVSFLQEAASMGQFNHPYVVKLYGVVTVGDPIMICMELMARGDLQSYLGSLSPNKHTVKELELQLLRFSRQIASGMVYLSKKAFVHRDLAARNVLVDESINCKISDFGMARDLIDDTYYTVQSKGGKIPIKWTAPEALFYKKYSCDSDVWSFGMVLFEIWSVGKKPFSEMSNAEVMEKLNSGYCQPPPPGCPRGIYQLMINCWNPVHSKRPSFSKISASLNESTCVLLQCEEGESPKADVLGKQFSEDENVYKDLQNIYLSSQT